MGSIFIFRLSVRVFSRGRRREELYYRSRLTNFLTLDDSLVIQDRLNLTEFISENDTVIIPRDTFTL